MNFIESYLFTLPEVKFLLLIKLTTIFTTCWRDGNPPLPPWFKNLTYVLYEKHHNILLFRASLHEALKQTSWGPFERSRYAMLKKSHILTYPLQWATSAPKIDGPDGAVPCYYHLILVALYENWAGFQI